MYYSQPFYNEGKYGIEKSLVSLGTYKKTSLLDIGNSETVKLNLNVRTVTFKDANVKVADRDLFYLVLKGDAAIKAEDNKISATYTEAFDRIGHSTKLYIGSRPEPQPIENRRQGM